MRAKGTLEIGMSVNTNEITLFFFFSRSLFLSNLYSLLPFQNYDKHQCSLSAPLAVQSSIKPFPHLRSYLSLSRPLYVQGQLKSIQASSPALKGHTVSTGHFFISAPPPPPLPPPSLLTSLSVCFSFPSLHYSLHQCHICGMYYNKQDMLISCFVGCFLSCQPVSFLSSAPS